MRLNGARNEGPYSSSSINETGKNIILIIYRYI